MLTCRQAGLPQGHPLNPTSHTPGDDVVGDEQSSSCGVRCLRDADRNVRRLLTSVFSQKTAAADCAAMKNGRVSVLCKGDADRNALDRNGVLSGGSNRAGPRLPKRMAAIRPLMKDMLERAQRCNLGRLLEAHCPLPQGFRKRRLQLGRGGRRARQEEQESACSTEIDVSPESTALDEQWSGESASQCFTEGDRSRSTTQEDELFDSQAPPMCAWTFGEDTVDGCAKTEGADRALSEAEGGELTISQRPVRQHIVSGNVVAVGDSCHDNSTDVVEAEDQAPKNWRKAQGTVVGAGTNAHHVSRCLLWGLAESVL